MRRLPVYFLVDVSESMVGEPIRQVEEGMRSIIQELRTDPYALETAFVSVIVFAGRAKSLSPLTELYKFYPPVFPIGGGTALGAALDFLMDDMDRNLVKNSTEQKGDWKPIIFLFTDGTPTDDPTPAINKWNSRYRRSANIVAISIGDNADTNVLGKLTENVLRLKGTDEVSFKAFFKWVTASIKTTSVSVSNMGEDDVKLAPIEGSGLSEVDITKPRRIDENFAILYGKCSSTMKTYLLKFAKRVSNMEGFEGLRAEEFRYVGGYPIDEKTYVDLSNGKSKNSVSTLSLSGSPTCPCCGNMHGVVICECGGIFCSDGKDTICPWCGNTMRIQAMEEGGMNITAGEG